MYLQTFCLLIALIVACTFQMATRARICGLCRRMGAVEGKVEEEDDM